MPKVSSRFTVSERWTPELAKKWTPVSDRFLERYHLLGINSSEALVIIHLICFKWDSNLPRPAVSTLAERMGISETAVRNNLRTLESKGLLKRLPQKGRANLFDLKPLFEKLMLSDAALAIPSRRRLPAKGEDDD